MLRDVKFLHYFLISFIFQSPRIGVGRAADRDYPICGYTVEVLILHGPAHVSVFSCGRIIRQEHTFILNLKTFCTMGRQHRRCHRRLLFSSKNSFISLSSILVKFKYLHRILLRDWYFEVIIK